MPNDRCSHKSTPSHLDRVQWSGDLRYQLAGTSKQKGPGPKLPSESATHPSHLASPLEQYT
jgi:hypothetical protein